MSNITNLTLLLATIFICSLTSCSKAQKTFDQEFKMDIPTMVSLGIKRFPALYRLNEQNDVIASHHGSITNLEFQMLTSETLRLLIENENLELSNYFKGLNYKEEVKDTHKIVIFTVDRSFDECEPCIELEKSAPKLKESLPEGFELIRIKIGN